MKRVGDERTLQVRLLHGTIDFKVWSDTCVQLDGRQQQTTKNKKSNELALENLDLALCINFLIDVVVADPHSRELTLVLIGGWILTFF